MFFSFILEGLYLINYRIFPIKGSIITTGFTSSAKLKWIFPSYFHNEGLFKLPIITPQRVISKQVLEKKITRTLADSKKRRTFATLLTKSTSRRKFWRDGRVVDRGGLENRCTERYRGFESLSLRKEEGLARMFASPFFNT